MTYEASFEYMTLRITTILRLTKYYNMDKKVSVIVMTELKYNVNVVEKLIIKVRAKSRSTFIDTALQGTHNRM